MKLTIEIKTDDAAFEESEHELYAILTSAAPRFTPGESDKLYDTNGNHVGFWEWR